MKKILGLDLGSSSIGWAIVELGEDCSKIVDMGSRIVPLTTDDESQFTKGQAISKNADRTAKRTARKGYDRYQQRRDNLKRLLSQHGIEPSQIVKPICLWELRSKAVTEQISLNDLGRILLHINQKRGYRSGKEDFNDSAKSKYVQSVNDNYKFLVEKGITLGQYFYQELLKDGAFRIKDRVYPRIAYIEEFDRIINNQKTFYPDILTDDFIKKIKNETIFFQRKLKSCKHLVSICEFEKKEYEKADGTTVVSGPHVAPKSSPVAQLCKIWEFVNTITITNRANENFEIGLPEKQKIAAFLETHDKIKITDLQKILGFSKKDGWWIDQSISKRVVGNTTRIRIEKALNNKYPDLLRMSVSFSEYADKDTGEIRNIVDEAVKTEPFFRLWHTLYSISDETELRHVLENKFNIVDEDVLSELCKIDFVKEAYASKSSTAIRKILPFLMQGHVYSDACALAGYNHSNYITKEENLARDLNRHVTPIQKGEMRQPIVEKILNQTINVTNSLIDEYGKFDEIRVELARELKQSREEREETSKRISKNERDNKVLAEKISEYGFTPTRNRILKMKIWDETGHCCIYCGQPVNVSEFLSGIDVEKEHIIPRSLLFDDSQGNVTCSCRKCNQEKGNQTAFDYMRSKGDSAFDDYKKRVDDLFQEGKIGKNKRNKLLMSAADIPDDFINRQLRETQYVAKKAMEILREVCYEVHATSGSVTDFLRHTWGWDNVLHDLHFEQYKNAGLTTKKEVSRNGNVRETEVISDWSKRLDHRHHAIDALAIACTSQSMIQQLNTLNTLKDAPFKSFDQQGDDFKEKHTRLERYVLSQPHFSTQEVQEAVERILISFKSGKKVTTPGKRYTYAGGKRTLQQRVLVPRGPLSEETVYGQIEKDGRSQVVVKKPVNSFDLKSAEKIVDARIREIIISHLKSHNNKITDDPVLDHQGRKIRSVRVFTGLDAVVPVKYNEANEPVGYVKPGNNHHIAIYKDKEGKFHESVVTFWHAVERKKYGIPVIIRKPDEVFDILPADLPDYFVAQLPHPDWGFVMSMQSNEMFVLGMPEDSYNDAVKNNDIASISKYLYRVQKLSHCEYCFRHHLETSVDDKYNGEINKNISIKLGKFIRAKSISTFLAYQPRKVRITNTGKLLND